MHRVEGCNAAVPPCQLGRETGGLPVVRCDRRDLGVHPFPDPVADGEFRLRQQFVKTVEVRGPARCQIIPRRELNPGLLDIFVCVTCFDGGGHPWILLSWPTHSGVRSRSLRTLPVEVRGSWPTKSTDLGALNFAMCSLTCTINSA